MNTSYSDMTVVQKEALRISSDMRKLYDSFCAGTVARPDANTRSNISGKNIKALSIILADEARKDKLGRAIEQAKELAAARENRVAKRAAGR